MISFLYIFFTAKSSYINVLSVILESKRNQDEWDTEYFDYISDSVKNGTNDSKFTGSCLDLLQSKDKIRNASKIYIFSDNSGKHFKNRLVMSKMMDFVMKLNKDVRWLFYAPDHGNSLCDAHFGRLSQKRRAAPGGSNNYATPIRLATLIDSMESTKAHIITINREKELKGKEIVGIKTIYSFHFLAATHSVDCFDHYGGVLLKNLKYNQDLTK